MAETSVQRALEFEALKAFKKLPKEQRQKILLGFPRWFNYYRHYKKIKSWSESDVMSYFLRYLRTILFEPREAESVARTGAQFQTLVKPDLSFLAGASILTAFGYYGIYVLSRRLLM